MSSLLTQVLQETSACGSSLWLLDESCLFAPEAAQQLSLVSSALSNRWRQWPDKAPGNLLVNDFNFNELPNTSYDSVVFQISKEKVLSNYCINQGIAHLRTGGMLHLLGQKSEGIKGYYKRISELAGITTRIKKQGTYYHISAQKHSRSPGQLDNADYQALREVENNGLVFFSKPGIYGWDKVDRGSDLLAQIVKQELRNQDLSSKNLLDLGCGYGYLPLALAELNFAQCVATDNNVAAIMACQQNVLTQKLAVDCKLDDAGQSLHELFHIIVCNPPFHQGFNQDRQLTKTFLLNIARLLSPLGACFLVANQFIPIASLAEPFELNCTLLLKREGFNIFKLKLN